jgi:hypothetical protein
LDAFEPTIRKAWPELRASRHAGDRIIPRNIQLNADIRAYYAYAIETVGESNFGRLIEELMHLPIPPLFLYGEANRTLSDVPRLRPARCNSKRIH